jgi:hypothetical protein
MHNFINPNKQIVTPNGVSIRPRITEREYDGCKYVEAQYIDPLNGTFVHRGTVSITHPDGTVESLESQV